ncbi:MAG: MFS transporter, partial [Raoultibacter sp.]
YRWVVLGVSCLIIFVADYIQFQLSALAIEIMPALGIDVAQFSALLLAPLLAGVFVSIPGGSLADKYGAKIVVGIATALSVILAFGRLAAGDFTMMLIMMLGTGIAPSVLQAATIKLFGAWFEEKMDFAMGIYFAAACCGIAAGLATSAFFPSVQDAYLWSSIAFAVVRVLWLVLAKNQPAGAAVPPSEPVMQYFGVAIKNKFVWLIAIATGLGMATATNYSGILPQAMVEVRGIDIMTANNMAAFLTIISIFGSIIGPVMCQKSGKPRIVLVIICLLGGAVMVANWYSPLGLALWIFLFFNGIFSAASGPILQALPFQLPEIGLKYAASAGGVIGSVSLIISYVLPIGIGMIAGTDYTLNFILEGAFFAIAFIPVLLLPKSLDRQNKEHAPLQPELEGSDA